ncbi:hypothetical protein [Sphingobacterium sp.]|uniref:hypothetical protein n=1 Tax=Sphingobacterium sp. TaxID=341027 RepID=UPI0028964637|nr:hypothetical protein [Sphingobacterium sp.]
MQNNEKTIQVYRPSLTHTVIYGTALTITLGVMILLTYAVWGSGLKVKEEGKSLILIGTLVLVVLALFFGFLLFRHRARPVFRIFADGVQLGSEPGIIPFSEISDVCLFLSGRSIGDSYNNLAFRRNAEDAWHVIAADYTGKTDTFLDSYNEPRLAYLEQVIEEGGKATFRYMPKKQNMIMSVNANSFLRKLKTAEIELGAKGMTLDTKYIDYADLQPLYLNGNEFEIRTIRQEVLAGFRYVDMMSFDVFRELYNRRTAKSGKGS